MSPRLAVLAFSTGLLVAAWPHSRTDIASAGVAALVVLSCSMLLWLFRGRFFSSLLVVLFGFAYAYHLTDALTQGVEFMGVFARPEDVRLAAATLPLFLATTLAVGWGASAALRRVSRGAWLRAFSTPGWDRRFWVALLVLFAATTAAAFTSGAWTFYGADKSDPVSGGIRLELFYVPALVSTCLVAFRLTARRWRSGGFGGVYLAVLAVLFVLLFVLQNRRTFLAALAGGALILVQDGGIRTKARAVVAGSVAAALVVGMLVGTEMWRGGESQVEDRMTYLWIDALSIRLGEGHFPLEDAALGALANVTPQVLFPEKYLHLPIRCEDSFSIPEDLPCTPTSEGYLGMGFLGVALVGVLWGLTLGIAEYVWTASSGVVAVVLATLLVVPMFEIEAGAFGVAWSLRNAVIFGGAWFALAVLLRSFLVVRASRT